MVFSFKADQCLTKVLWIKRGNRLGASISRILGRGSLIFFTKLVSLLRYETFFQIAITFNNSVILSMSNVASESNRFISRVYFTPPRTAK